MSKSKRKAATQVESETREVDSRALGWEGVLTDEVIALTRLEVEAFEEFNPESNPDRSLVDVRRWLRIGELQEDRRTWLYDLELENPTQGSPYRFLVHLFAAIKDSDPHGDSDEAAGKVMTLLTARLYSVASEQLFAATVRGPWGPLSLPPLPPPKNGGGARRITDEAWKASFAIVDLLDKEGPLPKVELARRFGADFEDAYKVVKIQGLVEEEDSMVRLRNQ